MFFNLNIENIENIECIKITIRTNRRKRTKLILTSSHLVKSIIFNIFAWALKKNLQENTKQ